MASVDATLVFTSVPGPTISTTRDVLAEGGAILYARVAILVSMRREKAESRRRVRTCVKGGESMRSDVSSRRCRSAGEIGDEEVGSEGEIMPAAWRR